MDTEPTFEGSFSELQEVVNKLEQGNLGLEAVTELYSQGFTLAANCRKRLEATESRIELVQQTYGMPTNSGEPSDQ